MAEYERPSPIASAKRDTAHAMGFSAIKNSYVLLSRNDGSNLSVRIKPNGSFSFLSKFHPYINPSQITTLTFEPGTESSSPSLRVVQPINKQQVGVFASDGSLETIETPEQAPTSDFSITDSLIMAGFVEITTDIWKKEIPDSRHTDTSQEVIAITSEGKLIHLLSSIDTQLVKDYKLDDIETTMVSFKKDELAPDQLVLEYKKDGVKYVTVKAEHDTITAKPFDPKHPLG